MRPGLLALLLGVACLFLLVSSPAAQLLPSAPDWTAADGTDFTNFATDVNTAGDVNGDGYSDVIISCPGLNADDGAAFVYCGGPNGIGSTPCWVAHGTQPGLQFSNDSFAAGDVNGDGYGDIIVGARGYDYIGAGNTFEGAVFVYHGSPSGPSASPDWQDQGDIEDMQLGFYVSTAGDLNGDGYDDVLVAAREPVDTIHAYFGSASGLSSSPDWTAAGFGLSMAAAGDVDADGYDDVLIGTSNNVRIFRGSATGPSATPDWNLSISSGSGPVAPAGDVNGDGYADILVGRPEYGSQDTGRAYLYYGSATGPGTSIDFAPSGLTNGAEFGTDLQTAGDVNADGFADVIIGAHFFDAAESNAGRAYLYLGGPDGLVTTPAWSFSGAGPNDYLGRAVSGAGDTNGDGYSDIIVGAPGGSLDHFTEGIAYAFYGTPTGLNETLFAVRLLGQSEAGLGYSVAYAGDLNGDGLGDIVSSAIFYDGDFTDEGTIVVHHGTPTGGDVLDYAAQRYGEQEQEYFGLSADRAGDVNGDGFDDLIVGAPLHDATFTDGGAAYVYHGSPTGIPTSPNWSTFGSSETAWHGFDVAGAGDVNGDGYADVLVGALAYSGAFTNEGAAYLYLGSESGLAATPTWTVTGGESNLLLGQTVAGAGDVNGDGYSDIAVSSPNYSGSLAAEGAVFVYLGSPGGPATTPDWTVFGRQADARMDRVAGAGDVNGDGYDDLLVGTPFFDAVTSQEGRVECFYGSVSGLSATPDWTVEGTSLLGGWLGRAVSTAGDVNRDGYADILVSEQNYDGTFQNEGAVYVYHGGPSGLTLGSMHTSLQEDSGFGFAASTAGDLNGDGFADIIVGAQEYDASQTDEGAMFVYLGNGHAPSGGLDIRPRQETTTGDPITLLGMSDSPSQFVLAAHGRSIMGRGRVRAEWQVAEVGTSLDSQPIESSPWYDTGAPIPELGSVAQIEESILGLSPDTQYHWRVRTRSRSLYVPVTMWASIAPTGSSMAHLRTSSVSSSVPGDGTEGAWGSIRGVAPNPMQTATSVSFRTMSSGHVTVSVHDVSGRQVARILDEPLRPGPHAVQWDGTDANGRRVPSGLYLVRVTTAEGSAHRKIWVLR